MQGTREMYPARNGVGLAGFVNGGLRSMSGALRRAESVLLAGGQQTARRNAWDAVCENRRWAQDRAETDSAAGGATRMRL